MQSHLITMHIPTVNLSSSLSVQIEGHIEGTFFMSKAPKWLQISKFKLLYAGGNATQSSLLGVYHDYFSA